MDFTSFMQGLDDDKMNQLLRRLSKIHTKFVGKTIADIPNIYNLVLLMHRTGNEGG